MSAHLSTAPHQSRKKQGLAGAVELSNLNNGSGIAPDLIRNR